MSLACVLRLLGTSTDLRELWADAMLERQWSAAAGQPEFVWPARDSEFIGFADITSFVRQRIFLIMAFPLLGLLGAVFS